MEFGLAGKVAIVSGGSQGMGFATAAELVREGARVVIAARSPDKLRHATAELTRSGGQAAYVVADMADEDAVREAVAFTTERYGSPDIAVANVLPPHRVGFDSCSYEDFLASYQLLTMSVVYLVREVLPAMKEKRWGRIVNIGSHAAKEPHISPSLPLANMGRLAANGLMKNLAFELGPYNITANTIAVGTIKTPRSAWFLEQMGVTEEYWATEKREIPAGRFGRAEEIAAVITFLASERASFVSGETIRVDGGAGRALF